MGLGIGIGLSSVFGRRGGFAPQSKLLFAVFESLSVSLSDTEKTAYDTAIKALIACGLWAKTDHLQVPRQGYEASSLVDWKSATVRGEADKTDVDDPDAVFTTNVGWTTNGIDNFINTGFNPFTMGVNFTPNNAGFIFKSGNNVPSQGYSLGAYGTSANRISLMKERDLVNMRGSINGTPIVMAIEDSRTDKFGYYSVCRKDATTTYVMKDEFISSDYTNNAYANLVNRDITVGKENGLLSFAPEVFELVWFGSALTQEEFNTFQEIMDAFFFDMDVILALDVKEYGAVGDGTTDDWSAIQTLLSDSTVNSIKIGDSRSDTFLLSQCIKVPSNKTIVINGSVHTKEGVYYDLVADTPAYSPYIYPESLVGFNVGEHIAWGDDNGAVQGGSYQTRKVAASAFIVDVDTDNNRLEVNYGVDFDVTVAANGKMGHWQPCFYGEPQTEKINIVGNGFVSAKTDNPIDMYAIYSGEGGEMSSAIILKATEKLRILGLNGRLEIEGGKINGIAVYDKDYYSDDIIIKNVLCHSAHDKNCLLGYSRNILIEDCEFNDSEFEDGLIFYVNCSNVKVNNITAKRNRRGGLFLNNNLEMNAIVDGVQLESNGRYDLAILASDVNVSNVSIKGNPIAYNRLFGVYLSYAYDLCENVEINNILIDGITAKYVFIIIGDAENVDINNLVIQDSEGVGIKASDNGGIYNLPIDVNITGGGIYNHTGTKVDIQSGADVTFNNFEGLD